VQLGFRSSVAGNFNIGIDQTDGILKAQNIVVEDKVLNIVHDLKTAPYAFYHSGRYLMIVLYCVLLKRH
jgi:hypothetical protein